MWLVSEGSDLEVTKTEPVSIGLNVAVTVRSGDGTLQDGVWLNGQPSFDTYVLVDDAVRFHSPVEDAAGDTFDKHDAAGGGVPL